MKEIALKFFWHAPIERVVILILLVFVYFLAKKAQAAELQYQNCLIEKATMQDSLRVYYNGIIENDLRTRIGEYDKLIQKMKDDEKERH